MSTPASALVAPRRSQPRWSRPRFTVFGGVAVLASALLAFVVIFALAQVVKAAVFPDGSFSLQAVREVVQDPTIPGLIRNTVVITVLSTLMAVLIACVFAWLNERTDARIGWAARILPITPLLIPGIAGVIGWVTLFSPNAGLLNVVIRDVLAAFGMDLQTGPFNIGSNYGLIALYIDSLIPFAYVIVQPAFQNIDGSLEEAARVSGAGASKTMFRVTLPAMLPTLISAVVLAGVVSFALFTIPAVVGTQADVDVLSTRIYRYLTATYPPATGSAVTLTLLILVVTMSLVFFQRWLVGRGRHAVISGKATPAAPIRLGRWRPVARIFMGGYLVMSALVALGGLFYLSMQGYWSSELNFSLNFDSYRTVFGEGSSSRAAITNSVVIGLATATAAIVMATVIATYAHRSRTRLGRAADSLAKLPATISALILAVGILLAFSGPPFNLGDTSIILFIGYLVLYIPFASFSANAAIGQIGEELSEAAMVSGASEMTTFLRVQLPLMLPTLIGGWVLVFVVTMADVTASALLSGLTTPVAGFQMLFLMEQGSYPQVAAMGVVMAFVSMSFVAAVYLLNRRGRVGTSGVTGVRVR